MTYQDKNCSTCGSEDNNRSEWPCSQCDPRWFDKWSPQGEVNKENDLWDM